MGSKDRILRHKENTRHNILQAALHIGKENGWQNLSMRKIADAIEYSSPIIYAFWSMLHGLIAINLTRQDMPENINALILEETITTMMEMLTNAASNNQ